MYFVILHVFSYITCTLLYYTYLVILHVLCCITRIWLYKIIYWLIYLSLFSDLPSVLLMFILSFFLLILLSFKLKRIVHQVDSNQNSHLIPFTSMPRRVIFEETPLRVTREWPYVITILWCDKYGYDLSWPMGLLVSCQAV
jgi:hypothetical protein